MPQPSTSVWILRTGKLVPVAILLLSLALVQGQEKDKSEGEQWFNQLDAGQLADLEEKVQKAYARIAPSVVRIYAEGQPESSVSGVIITGSGEVLTCAHHDLPPRTKVTVELADGRKAAGTTLGLVRNPNRGTHYRPRSHDIGMIRLDEEGEWPAAALGRPSELENGAICLAVGYPYVHKPGQKPLLRVGRVLPPAGYGSVRSSCRVLQGDSGGPLFDLQGRVLGVLSGMSLIVSAGSDYASVEVFAELAGRLRNSEEIVIERVHPKRPIAPQKHAWGAFEPAAEVAQAAGTARQSTVEILGDAKPAAWGLIVEPDGWIVTKRTELSGCERIVCHLPDGRQLEARVAGSSKEHDLALLKVDAADLPACTWARADGLRVGQLIASPAPGQRPLHFGVVGAARVSNPGVKGFLPVNGKETTPEGLSGPVVTEVWPNRPDVGNLRELLKAGDLITHLDDLPTPGVMEYVTIRDERVAAPDALIGERIKLTLRRGEETLRVFAPIIPSTTVSPYLWKGCPLSLRRNGFPDVFSHDGGAAPEHCGGPVVDLSGEVVGINIARADEVQTFAIPGDVVRKIVSELKTTAGKQQGRPPG